MLIYKCVDCGRSMAFPNLFKGEKITRNRLCVKCKGKRLRNKPKGKKN